MQMISLLHFIFFLLLPLASTSNLTRKLSCLNRCGDVSIPYPFGVGSGCSLGNSFNITCNTSTTPPKPYINIDGKNIQVIEITLENPAQIRIMYPYPLYGACYNISSAEEMWSDWNPIDLSETQYTLSENNWLTVLGCDDFVAATTSVGNNGLRDACIGYCYDSGNGSGSCPNNDDGNSVGEGCCQAPILKGASYLGASLVDLSRSWNRTRVFPCSYAFIKEKGIVEEDAYKYDFSILQHNSTTFLQKNHTKTKLPVVRLDWRVGDQNCSRARRNASSFACGANTHCVDFSHKVKGYHCNCSEGYSGNPYLGCTDIDECADKNRCGSHSHCFNTIGSFYCSCERGFTHDENGCTRFPPNMINIVLIVMSSASGLILVLLLGFWLRKVLVKRNNRKRKETLFKYLLLQQQTSEGTFGKTKLFTAKELEKATDHFNESRICGKGGQGIVYKGMLSDGTIVAIKILRQVDESRVDEFINEVVILSQINHKNVVRLLGCCLATESPQLVYEFLPNGTLFDFIHVPRTEYLLTWNMRLNICADVAGALAYLHSASSIPIYHRDIKSKNILLDEKYTVKVSDFGISKAVEVDQTHLTTLVKGTFGYLDPEYYQTSHYTDKSDVYSFGVVLIELLTGQQPISMERSEVLERNLAMYFLASMQENNLDAILDVQVLEQGGKEEVLAVARLARRCLNLKGRMRPTMKEVATELESLRISQTPSTLNYEPEAEEETFFQGQHMMFSDSGYTRTTGQHSMATSSSDSQRLMSQVE